MTFLTVTGEGPALPFVDFHHASNVASSVSKVGNGGRGRGFEVLGGRERRVMVGLDGGRSSKVQLRRVAEGANVGAVDLHKLPHVKLQGFPGEESNRPGVVGQATAHHVDAPGAVTSVNDVRTDAEDASDDADVAFLRQIGDAQRLTGRHNWSRPFFEHHHAR